MLANSDSETNTFFICIIDKDTGEKIFWRKFDDISSADPALSMMAYGNNIFMTVGTTDNSEMGLIRFSDDIEVDQEENPIEWYYKVNC